MMRIPLLLAGSICLMAAVLLQLSAVEGRLLRADPNAIPGDPALMDFSLERGAALFAAHCAACHGLAGQADPARGIPSLSDADWLYGTGLVSDIEQVIKFGIRSSHPRAWNLAIMPAYARPRPSPVSAAIQPLSPANIRNIVEFLMLEQGHSADSGAAARGAALFAGAGGCYDCHAADAKGDAAIGAPNLTDGITLYGDGSRDALTLSIAYGRHGMCPSWERRIAPAGIREIALFVYSLSHPRGMARPLASGAG